MTIKFILKKTVALSLITSSLVKTYLSILDILFIYPKLILVQNSNQLYLELFKKAIIISSGLFIESIYGFSLLIKPKETTKFIHILFGIVLFMFSILFYKLSTFDQLIQNWLFSPIT
ncbi:MAG: hypothetical protein U9Q63_01055 [Patescibacteria group bacterium]|nr:hypothetical protein [Patescibacteria group bacterium]